jgi:hypothetical protein
MMNSFYTMDLRSFLKSDILHGELPKVVLPLGSEYKVYRKTYIFITPSGSMYIIYIFVL